MLVAATGQKLNSRLWAKRVSFAPASRPATGIYWLRARTKARIGCEFVVIASSPIRATAI